MVTSPVCLIVLLVLLGSLDPPTSTILGPQPLPPRGTVCRWIPGQGKGGCGHIIHQIKQERCVCDNIIYTGLTLGVKGQIEH